MLVEKRKSHPLFREILLRKFILFFSPLFYVSKWFRFDPHQHFTHVFLHVKLSPLQPPEAKTRSVRVRSFCRSRRLGWLMVSNVKRFTTERMLIAFHSYGKYILLNIESNIVENYQLYLFSCQPVSL